MEIQVSKHAEKRLRERCGLNNKSVHRMANKAFESGIKHRDTKGRLCKWVDGLYLSYRSANNIRLYGDKAYIFCNDTLVTVIQIPSGLRNDMKVMVKER